MSQQEEEKVSHVANQILNKIVDHNKEPTQDTGEEDEEYSLFNILEIKQKIIPHCRTVHTLMDNLYCHLLPGDDLIENREKSEDRKMSNYEILEKEIDEMLEISWTQLHTGHWSDVCQEWRSLHGLLCLLYSCIKLKITHSNWDITEWVLLLRKCDEGLMMGDNTYREYLHQVADIVHQVIVWKFGIPSLSNISEMEENDSKKPKLSQNSNTDLRKSLIFDNSHSIPIEDANSISLMEFKKKYFDSQTPCLLKNASKNWEAYRKWSDINYLLEKAAYRAVPVEIGQYYTSEDWSQKIMPFHQYVKEYVMEGRNASKPIGYLAQHPLFEQIHSLRKDIQEPIYCMLGELGEMSGVNAWYGPKGTISPLHTDPCDNILVQLVGHKFVRIYHPDETPHLYKRQSGLLQANTSEIDNLHLLEFEEKERIDLNEKFPLLSKTTKYWDCILSEGDMLFMPKMFWHYIQSLSISFSISYWFV